MSKHLLPVGVSLGTKYLISLAATQIMSFVQALMAMPSIPRKLRMQYAKQYIRWAVSRQQMLDKPAQMALSAQLMASLNKRGDRFVAQTVKAS